MAMLYVYTWPGPSSTVLSSSPVVLLSPFRLGSGPSLCLLPPEIRFANAAARELQYCFLLCAFFAVVRIRLGTAACGGAYNARCFQRTEGEEQCAD